MKKEKSQEELLRLQKLREYNRSYYQKHKEKIIQRVLKSREKTSELTKARWNLNYWSNKVKKLEQLENGGKNEGTN